MTTLHEHASDQEAPRTPPAGRQNLGRGLLFGLTAAAAFGSSGPFAKSLLVEGWSSGAIVLLRIGIATLILAVPTAMALRGRWHLVRTHLVAVTLYGALAVAGCQVAYFYAVSRLSVGVALLLEYLGVVLVVLWIWFRTRRAPGPITTVGVVLALTGLVFVLDLAGATTPDLLGVVWGLLAAIGLAVFYVMAAEDTELPPVALAGLGMGLGTVVLALTGVTGLVPMTFSSADVTILGSTLPWWVPVVELAAVAAAAAYVLGVLAARNLGSTLSSFLGLTEVLFAVVFAWLLLGELPGPVQAVGGGLILLGVVAVRLGELRRDREPVADLDFRMPGDLA